jgi:hypothetical protein
MASNVHPFRPSIVTTKFSDNATLLWYQKGGNPENNRIPLCPSWSTSSDTTDRPKCTHTTQLPCRFTLRISISRTLIESYHNTNVRLIRLNCLLTQIIKDKMTHSFIHSSVFTISLTAQAPISPLLPKSTSSVVLAKYHHIRSQDLANCQSQQKKTNN